MTPTPGTLRIVSMLFKWPHDEGMTIGGFDNAEDYLNATADAWQADIKDARVYEKMANHNADVIDAKQARIDALEKNIEVLTRAYGMVRWKMPRANWDVMNAAEELYRAALAGKEKT